MQTEAQAGVSLTPADIDRFLDAQKAAGLGECTRKRYRGDLEMLRAFLGPEAMIGPGTLERWETAMRNTGYAQRSVTARLMTANRYLSFCERGDLRRAPTPAHDVVLPAITLREYQILLRTAQYQNRTRVALLLRLFVELGVLQRALDRVTLETVAAGVIPAQGDKEAQELTLDLRLQWDLLHYAKAQGVRSGPIFVGRNGMPINRAAIVMELNDLAVRAGIPPERVTPRSLQKLHTSLQAATAYAHEPTAEEPALAAT